MNWLLCGKLLSILGTLGVMVPPFHILIETYRLNSLKPSSEVSGGMREILDATRKHFMEAIPAANCTWHLYLTLVGIVLIFGGFVVDFSCEAQLITNCHTHWEADSDNGLGRLQPAIN